MKKTKKEVVGTIKFWVVFALAIIIFFITMYLSMTTEYSWADFTAVIWWALFVVRIFLFIILYLDVYDYVYPLIISDEYGLTHNQIQIMILRVNHIKQNHLYPELDAAIARRNEDKFREEANAFIASVCNRLTYEDIEKDYAIPATETTKAISGWNALKDPDIDDIILNRSGITVPKNASKRKRKKIEKQQEKFREILKDIKAGNIYVDNISADGVMNKAFIDGIKKDLTGHTINGDIVRGHIVSIVRGIVGIFFSMGLTILSIALDGFVQGLIISLGIIFSAVGSGLIRSKVIETKVYHICEANNGFFLAYMNLDMTLPLPDRPKKEKTSKTKKTVDLPIREWREEDIL